MTTCRISRAQAVGSSLTETIVEIAAQFGAAAVEAVLTAGGRSGRWALGHTREGCAGSGRRGHGLGGDPPSLNLCRTSWLLWRHTWATSSSRIVQAQFVHC